MRMTTDILARAETELAAKVMVEVGGLLGRRRMSQADFARLLKVRPMWISDRFTGRVKLTVEDMDRMATALGVEVIELLPRPTRRVTETYPPTVRQRDKRPVRDAVKPVAAALGVSLVPLPRSAPPSPTRTARVGR